MTISENHTEIRVQESIFKIFLSEINGSRYTIHIYQSELLPLETLKQTNMPKYSC